MLLELWEKHQAESVKTWEHEDLRSCCWMITIIYILSNNNYYIGNSMWTVQWHRNHKRRQWAHRYLPPLPWPGNGKGWGERRAESGICEAPEDQETIGNGNLYPCYCNASLLPDFYPCRLYLPFLAYGVYNHSYTGSFHICWWIHPLCPVDLVSWERGKSIHITSIFSNEVFINCWHP